MKIIKESIVKRHSYDNGVHTSYTEKIEQYHYDSEEERNKHAEQMIKNGFKDSGQVKENIGTVMNPKLGLEATINMKEIRQVNKSFF